MDWNLAAVDRPATFEAGEPCCMLGLQWRAEWQRPEPRALDFEPDPEVSRGYAA